MEAVVEKPVRIRSPKMKHRSDVMGVIVPEKETPLSMVEKEMLEEVDAPVVTYLKSIPPIFEGKVLFLSAIYHYIFDSETLSDVNTVINLRLINRISGIHNFMHTMNRMLPAHGYYVGCFESHDQKKQRIRSMQPSFLGYLILNWYRMHHFLVLRRSRIRHISLRMNRGKIRNLSPQDLRMLLSMSGFELHDSRAIGKTTYFVAQKIQSHQLKKSGFFKPFQGSENL